MMGVIVIGITLSSYKEHQGDTKRDKAPVRCLKYFNKKYERRTQQWT